MTRTRMTEAEQQTSRRVDIVILTNFYILCQACSLLYHVSLR